MASMWRVSKRALLLLSSRVRMYARTNRAGFQKTPVTLRDNTNEGGGTMFGLVIVV